jgi:hypothetical protein
LDAEGRPEWKIILFIDFVSVYAITGNKTVNLVMSMSWNEKGNNEKKYVCNIVTDESRKSDSLFVMNIFQFHLDRRNLPTGIFFGVTHVYRSGDSGPHFQSRLWLAFESTIFVGFGIFWEVHTLCKRHAFNICDGFGAGVLFSFSCVDPVQGGRSCAEKMACWDDSCVMPPTLLDWSIASTSLPQPCTFRVAMLYLSVQRVCVC